VAVQVVVAATARDRRASNVSILQGGSMLKLQIIVGSTREGRYADAVLRWLLPVAKAHGAFDVEVLDLREWQLPLFQETLATIGDFKNPTYSQPIVKKWNQKIVEGDAYLFVTAEYNHSIPGVLKNAVDSVFLTLLPQPSPRHADA
jgi:NAD(P)H-dependent FMN reductase